MNNLSKYFLQEIMLDRHIFLLFSVGVILADTQIHITGFLICALISYQQCVLSFVIIRYLVNLGIKQSLSVFTNFLHIMCHIIIISDSKVFPVGNLCFKMGNHKRLIFLLNFLSVCLDFLPTLCQEEFE